MRVRVNALACIFIVCFSFYFVDFYVNFGLLFMDVVPETTGVGLLFRLVGPRTICSTNKCWKFQYPQETLCVSVTNVSRLMVCREIIVYFYSENRTKKSLEKRVLCLNAEPSRNHTRISEVASWRSFENLTLVGNLDKSRVFILQVIRTVATFLTAWESTASAFC
jgi:hypothetical protein